MKLTAHNLDWRTKTIEIKNKTMSECYPWLDSESKTMRLAYKSGM